MSTICERADTGQRQPAIEVRTMSRQERNRQEVETWRRDEKQGQACQSYRGNVCGRK